MRLRPQRHPQPLPRMREGAGKTGSINWNPFPRPEKIISKNPRIFEKHYRNLHLLDQYMNAIHFSLCSPLSTHYCSSPKGYVSHTFIENVRNCGRKCDIRSSPRPGDAAFIATSSHILSPKIPKKIVKNRAKPGIFGHQPQRFDLNIEHEITLTKTSPTKPRGARTPRCECETDPITATMPKPVK
jgi:hypothetical protein